MEKYVNGMLFHREMETTNKRNKAPSVCGNLFCSKGIIETLLSGLIGMIK
jgi:hypothetical protein